MAAYDSGSFKPRRDPTHLWWGLGGIVIGLVLANAVPRVWRRIRPASQKSGATAVVKPRPKTIETLQISADSAQRGLLLTAPVPVRLLKPSQTKLTKQQDSAVFTGFRSWGGTTGLLRSGQGSLVLKAATGTPTNWTQADLKGLLQKQPLKAQVAIGQPYTLFFQRKGRSLIDLGTFSVGGKAPSVEAKAPPDEKELPDDVREDVLEESPDDIPLDSPQDVPEDMPADADPDAPLDAPDATPAPID